jgi:hypothetical protein
VVLAAEPVCICGVDVAAPQQVRRSQQEPLEAFFAHFERQFTPAEVVFQAVRKSDNLCQGSHPTARGTSTRSHSHAPSHGCNDVQWRAIRGTGPGDDGKAAAFRQHWSLKEVCCITTGALTSTSLEAR